MPVPLFSPRWIVVILFYLCAQITFSVDYRQFRTAQQNWFKKKKK